MKIIKHDFDGKDVEHNPVLHYVNLKYPQINDETKKTYIEIELEHVRAADGIRIRYDGIRDGWSIEQASTFSWEVDDTECDEDWQEVAFIQAWARVSEEQ